LLAADAWTAIVDAGLLGIGHDEDSGGSGGSALDAALVIEALAAGPVAAPYLGTVLALGLLDAISAADPSPDASTVQALRAELLDGRPAAVVLADDLSALNDMGVVFDASEGCAVIGCADGRLVVADQFGWIDGVDLTRRLGRTRSVRPLAQVDADGLVRWQAFALTMVSADLLGVMSAALLEAVAHARERIQFGRPIGSFQAIQHLCADQLVTVEAARSSLWHAAWAVDDLDADDALSAARVTKAYCSAAAREVCEAAIQVWGGIGMTWECRAHLFLRRALQSRQVLGHEDHHLACIGASMTRGFESA
jgi:alkylation response protein AidB-like acyl-CoA dehydrogenase